MTASELVDTAIRIESDLLREGNPHDGYDWDVMQLARAVILAVRPGNRPYPIAINQDRQYAMRWEFWRSRCLEYINFEPLTPDTCDVGLDYAVDCLMMEAQNDAV